MYPDLGESSKKTFWCQIGSDELHPVGYGSRNKMIPYLHPVMDFSEDKLTFAQDRSKVVRQCLEMFFRSIYECSSFARPESLAVDSYELHSRLKVGDYVEVSCFIS